MQQKYEYFPQQNLKQLTTITQSQCNTHLCITYNYTFCAWMQLCNSNNERLLVIVQTMICAVKETVVSNSKPKRNAYRQHALLLTFFSARQKSALPDKVRNSTCYFKDTLLSNELLKIHTQS